jgi:putative membrane protein insertion efficiency factor
MRKNLNKIINAFFFALIALYQNVISRFISPSCRYYPSCSNYAKDAIRQFGVKGLFLILKRLLKCNPWFQGGHDPVPDKIIKKGKYE